MVDRVYEHSSEAVVMSVKNSVELRPWGTCEVFNVVKQVQRDRKGSLASASRLVTLWPSHHRAGSAVGRDVQIAFSSTFYSAVLCLFPSPSLTHALADDNLLLVIWCASLTPFLLFIVVGGFLESSGPASGDNFQFRRVWLIDYLEPKMLQKECLHFVSRALCLLRVIVQYTVQL